MAWVRVSRRCCRVCRPCHRPAFHLPTGGKASIAVRCSPVLYKLRKGAGADKPTASGMLVAPYRMVFAVATLDSVLVYDTQQVHPIAMLRNLHFEKLTDIAW